jgi:transposase-like protein
MTTSVECPKCRRKSLELGDGDPSCACGYSDGAEGAAKDYVLTVLGISEYETVKDGGELPISECPDCEMGDTLVVRLTTKGKDGAAKFICFMCGGTWKDRELTECDGAGNRNPHWAHPFDAAVCDACIDSAAAKDD